MKRTGTLFVLFVLVMSLVITGCGQPAPAAKPAAPAAPSAPSAPAGPPKNIKVAVVGPMTGSMAVVGQQFVDGAKLAVDEINAKGGVKGVKIQLITEDDRNDPKEAANIAQKLVQDKEVYGIIGSYSSTACFSSIPIYEKANIIQITPSASHPELPKRSKYQFRMWTGINIYSANLAEYTVKNLNKKKIAVMYVNNDFGISNYQTYVNTAKALGAQVVAQEVFTDNDKDFKPQLTKIKAAQPDVLVIQSYYVDGALIAQQARAAGINAAIVGTGTFMEPEFLKLAGKAAEGIVFVTEFHPDDPKPAVQNFIKKFAAAYPGKQPAPYHATSYDAVGMLAKALEDANFDKAKVADTYAAIKNYSGAQGVISWDKDKEIIKESVFVEIKNGKFLIAPPLKK